MRLAYIDVDGNMFVQDGTSPARQITTSGDAQSLQLNTDGTQIAYVRIPENFPPELWVIHTDGTNAHRVLSSPAIERLNPELTSPPDDYHIEYHWIPNHDELIVYVWNYDPTVQGRDPLVRAAVQRLNVGTLAMSPFPGPFESPFSPDGEWFAMPEDNSLTLMRTDGSEEHHRVLDGYRFIGISSYSILPPLAWLPDGVRIIFPRQDYPEGDPRVPPFEIWDVPFDGSPRQSSFIPADADLYITAIYLAPNGQYYAHWNVTNRWFLTEIGGKTYEMGSEPLSLVWWDPTSTRFLHQALALYISDICGNTTLISDAVGQNRVGIIAEWVDSTRALIKARIYVDGKLHPAGIYWFDATDNSFTQSDYSWRDADAVLLDG